LSSFIKYWSLFIYPLFQINIGLGSVESFAVVH
jgi:hypothetical protein